MRPAFLSERIAAVALTPAALTKLVGEGRIQLPAPVKAKVSRWTPEFTRAYYREKQRLHRLKFLARGLTAQGKPRKQPNSRTRRLIKCLNS